jgi:hypothetical protein
MILRVMRALLAVLLVGACGHEGPWQPAAPPPSGPFSDAVPRRLTFNLGDDRAPAVGTGPGASLVAFARFDPVESPTPCIAVIPVAGGTLARQHCPPARGVLDTFTNTWTAPALSPDGRQVAFLWERYGRTAELGAWTSELVVAAVESPSAPGLRVLLQDPRPDGYVNSVIEPAWINGTTVRFLAAYDSIWKVKGGGAERFTDSLLVPRLVMDLDVTTGAVTPVPGGDSARAWTPAAGGGFWIVREPARLLHVLNGQVSEVDAFSQPVLDLALVDGLVVAALGDAAIEWIDPATGARGQIATAGPVRRVSGGAGRRFVAEVERGVELFGSPANLWLLEVP